MQDSIKNFTEQFGFVPVIENADALATDRDSFVLCGMGGSHLSAGLLKIIDPTIDMYIHRDYGLPLLSEKRFKNSLFIASSYSGNTEEVVDFATQAFEKEFRLAVIATGGTLLEFAKKNNLPYIELPQTGIQPRSAIGYSLLALIKMIGNEELFEKIKSTGSSVEARKFAKSGLELATKLKGRVPIIYSSRANLSLAYIWKIIFNETAKIPAFYNTFPELNHNEMTGFDVIPQTKNLSENMHFIFLSMDSDSPRITKRMNVLETLLRKIGFGVDALEQPQGIKYIFESIVVANWTALELSKMYGTEPDKVPMVEEFKRLMAAQS